MEKESQELLGAGEQFVINVINYLAYSLKGNRPMAALFSKEPATHYKQRQTVASGEWIKPKKKTSSSNTREKHSPNTGEKWEQEEFEKIGRVINKAWKDAESGKYNCKACGASPGTEHKNDCKWLVRKRNEKTKPSQKKPVDNCCECYCEKCRDCYRQPCKIHKPSHYTGTPATTSTGTYFPSQKKDKRTYEETLETVRKLSKLMQKEGWEKELRLGLDQLFEDLHSYTGPNIDENFTRTYEYTKSFIKSLLKEERERIKKELSEVIEKV